MGRGRHAGMEKGGRARRDVGGSTKRGGRREGGQKEMWDGVASREGRREGGGGAGRDWEGEGVWG